MSYGYPPAPPPPKKGVSGWLIAGAVALAVVGTCVGAVATAGKTATAEKKKAEAGRGDARSVDANALVHAYAENAARTSATRASGYASAAPSRR